MAQIYVWCDGLVTGYSIVINSDWVTGYLQWVLIPPAERDEITHYQYAGRLFSGQ
jgi:hypothetical protein